MPQTSPEPSLQTVAIFDLDNTITCKDTYLAFLWTLLRNQPARLLRCATLPIAVLLFKIGIKDNSWLKETFLQAIAGGMTRKQLKTCSSSFLDQLIRQGLRPGALAAIKYHKQAKHPIILATASFDFYVQELGQRLGFDQVICTTSCWDKQHKLVGKIVGKNCYGNNKLDRLQQYFGNNRQHLYLVGYTDHHSDQPFLEWVDQAIVINPTEQLRKIALQKKLEIKDW
jgi:HAD superfamily hydrolase (TIGR01490 family)